MPRTALLLGLSMSITGAGPWLLGTAPLPRRPPVTSNRPAPEWKNQSWLNTDHPLTLESLRGRVVLLNFWVFTCYNCTQHRPLAGRFRPEVPGPGADHHRHPYAGIPALRRRARHGRKSNGRCGPYDINYPNAQDNDATRPGISTDPLLAQLRADRQAGPDPVRGGPGNSIWTTRHSRSGKGVFRGCSRNPPIEGLADWRIGGLADAIHLAIATGNGDCRVWHHASATPHFHRGRQRQDTHAGGRFRLQNQCLVWLLPSNFPARSSVLPHPI